MAVKYREWNALLAKVYGSAVGDQELFLRHTYLTVLSRAIVTMVLFPRTSRTYALYRELLTGQFFKEKSILNLAEPDFFSWALDTPAEKPFLQIIDALFKRLEEFDWNKLDEDLLKMLYQELVDPADRSGLGEFYTPDWLAEMILDDIGYKSGSLLDPACGSGTFLFCAVRRLRDNGIEGKGLVEHVMNSIIGLDVPSGSRTYGESEFTVGPSSRAEIEARLRCLAKGVYGRHTTDGREKRKELSGSARRHGTQLRNSSKKH